MKEEDGKILKSTPDRLGRREMLKQGSRLATLLALRNLPLSFRSAAIPPVRFSTSPFSLGVASGDPLPDAVVL